MITEQPPRPRGRGRLDDQRSSRLDHLPRPQRDALRTAFGLSAGDPPDCFLVGLAVLGLLAEVAEERPLICVMDDAQWLDRASAQALAFAARRLVAESVGVVFAACTGEAMELTGLAQLVVTGLPDDEARELLCSTLRGPLDERVRDRWPSCLQVLRTPTKRRGTGRHLRPDCSTSLQDLDDDFPAFNDVHARRFPVPSPVRTTVGGVLADFLVEVRVVAVGPPRPVVDHGLKHS